MYLIIHLLDLHDIIYYYISWYYDCIGFYHGYIRNSDILHDINTKADHPSDDITIGGYTSKPKSEKGYFLSLLEKLINDTSLKEKNYQDYSQNCSSQKKSFVNNNCCYLSDEVKKDFHKAFIMEKYGFNNYIYKNTVNSRESLDTYNAISHTVPDILAKDAIELFEESILPENSTYEGDSDSSNESGNTITLDNYKPDISLADVKEKYNLDKRSKSDNITFNDSTNSSSSLTEDELIIDNFTDKIIVSGIYDDLDFCINQKDARSFRSHVHKQLFDLWRSNELDINNHKEIKNYMILYANMYSDTYDIEDYIKKSGS